MRWLAFVAAVFIAPLARADDASEAMALHDQMTAGGPAKDGAQYKLATVLYRMGFKQAAYGLFADIAERPTHAKWSEALVWLGKLGSDLPAAADVSERVGKYDDAHIAMLHDDAHRDVFAEIEWLSGEYAYRNRNFDDAIARFSRIERTSQLYGKAQMMTGMANVQARRSVPSVQAFERVIEWLDQGATPADATRLRDLANLSMARTYYSAAIRVGEVGFDVDASKLGAAAKYYRRVSPAGEFFIEAIFEDAWTRHWAGDETHALGEARLASSSIAEAGVLEALIQYGACRYDDATSAITRMRQTYEPKKRALASELDALDKASDDENWKLAMRSPEATDHKMTDLVAYESLLDAERKRFAAMPAAFRASQLGNDVADALALARDIVHRNIAVLGRERIQRAKDEIDESLRNAMKISIDIVAAQKNALENAIADGARTPPPPPPARPRTITLSWPINGHTPDPLYAAPITSACH